MSNRHGFFRIFVLAALSVTAGSGLKAADTAYQFITEIHIGGEGGWDYLTVEPGARRLYVSHSTKVVVIDLEKNAV
ncbi:MAG: hypothetical protein WAO20_22315, partial [Acidobacteriota bacterium]